MLNKLCLVFLLLGYSFISESQTADTYLVTFKDKPSTSEALAYPEFRLSQRAIARRQKNNVSFSERDLLVHAPYIDSLKSLGGLVGKQTKWLNGAIVDLTLDQKKALESKAFVSSITLLKLNGTKQPAFRKGLKTEDYGGSFNQNALVGIDYMHSQDVTGEGVRVAVFDSGFPKANELSGLSHLVLANKLHSVYDFVDSDSVVYNGSDHGTRSLSIIGGYMQGSLIGAAYNADFYLYRTENDDLENKVEEVHWLLAAEHADSLGIDVINSSLGYYDFDDAETNYLKSDLDGKTSIISRAATIASEVGIVVVSSAGNEGNNAWKNITFPNDAFNIISVGSVNSSGILQAYSSVGPTSDGRIKPDVAAMGHSTTLLNQSNTTSTSSGTSFAAPIITGLVAGLIQAYPTWTVLKIIEEVKKSGTQYNSPDNKMGYGIPSFLRIQQRVSSTSNTGVSIDFMVYPNPLEADEISFYFQSNSIGKPTEITITNIQGQSIYRQDIDAVGSVVTVSPTWQQSGYYILTIRQSESVTQLPIVKLHK